MKNIVLILGMLLAIVSTSFSQDLGDYKTSISYTEKGVNDNGVQYYMNEGRGILNIYFVDDDGYITEYKTIINKLNDYIYILDVLKDADWVKVESDGEYFFVKDSMAIRYYKASYGYVLHKFYI